MRIILVLLFSFLLIGCKKEIIEKDSIIPAEYRYPIEKIGQGKAFYYRTIGPYHAGYTCNLTQVTESGKKYLTYTTYFMDKFKTDSIKTSTEGKLLESYNFDLLFKMQYEPLKAKFIDNRIENDGSKYGKRITSIIYKGKNRDITIKEEERHIYDTILHADSGALLKCFVTETKSEISYKTKGKEIAKEETKKRSYYGKRRGLYMYTIESKDESTDWYQNDVGELKDGTTQR